MRRPLRPWRSSTPVPRRAVSTRNWPFLGLPLIDKILLGGVAGSKEHNVYLAVITVPETGLIQYGRFAGVHLAAGSQLHRVLLGRTFLKTSVLIYDGRTGRVTLAC